MSGQDAGGVVVNALVGGKPTNNQEGKKESTASRLARLELAIGDCQDSLSTLEEQVKVLEQGDEDLRGGVLGAVNELAGSLREDLLRLVREEVAKHNQAINEKLEEFKAELVVCRAAVAGGATVREAPKIKVPEPPKYNGKRDAKELDNFLWSVERYFNHLQIQDDASKITTATMYLSDDAILWWRRREADERKGTFRISPWDEFKADFKRQFYPENAKEIALKKLRALKHTGSIREYIKQYSSLLLEIEDMPENLSFLYFMDGLQRWAEQELKRRNVKTLSDAIAVAESLYEIRSEPRKERIVNKGGNKEKGGGATPQSSSSSVGKFSKDKDKGKTKF
ncbi:hypothetical protein RND81_06G030600 [Saponaria officinalis]|uniref:Ty3 transposon capsid-like protein domain-containing protein n=1 Tax=Saponaria officinalis TaxID=3572 RepID=A0AAW1K3P0_SAPOF